ncbi:MAG: hypothetical protein H6741_19770 [Alphaproteobacteria bacterium]|nr:hypothetical protein [Alphaproteobacteria bacterium]MCB9794944.1 hypothetical protein [Alphaproteobacteria bacterium]
MLRSAHLTLLLGHELRPAAAWMIEDLESAQVYETAGRDGGGELIFRVTTTRRASRTVLGSSALAATERIALVLHAGRRPKVIFDGFIIQRLYDPTQSRVTLRLQDASWALSRMERQVARNITVQALVPQVLSAYASPRFQATVKPSGPDPQPDPVDSPRQQRGTDLAFLRGLAQDRHDVFTLHPGATPGEVQAWFGPPVRLGPPTARLRLGSHGDSNLRSLWFDDDPTRQSVSGGKKLNEDAPRAEPVEDTRPPAPRMAAADSQEGPGVRTVLGEGGRDRTPAHTGSGEADVAALGAPLQAFSVVQVAGAGTQHDGLWWLNSVTTRVARGRLSQSFRISREGLGALVGSPAP